MPKRGPRTEPFLELCRARTVSLDDLSVTMLTALGGGNLSRGIREAARFAYDCYQAGSFIPPSTRNAAPAVPLPPSASSARDA